MTDYHDLVTGEVVRDDEQLFIGSGDGASAADHRVFGPVNGIYFIDATILPIASTAADPLITAQFVIEEYIQQTDTWQRVCVFPMQLCLDMPNNKFKRLWVRLDAAVGFAAGMGTRKLRGYCDFLTPVGKHNQYFAQWMVAYD